MAWKKIVNKKDFKVWKNPANKQVVVFKNSFITSSGRRYIHKSKVAAMKRAIAYMRKK